LTTLVGDGCENCILTNGCDKKTGEGYSSCCGNGIVDLGETCDIGD